MAWFFKQSEREQLSVVYIFINNINTFISYIVLSYFVLHVDFDSSGAIKSEDYNRTEMISENLTTLIKKMVISFFIKT